jgi:hypothetical protein
MLIKNKDRVCTHFAVDYELQLGTRLAAAADLLCHGAEPTRAGTGGGMFFDFQWPKEHRHILVGARRTAIETLGLSPWIENVDTHLDLVCSILTTLEVKSVQRIGFKVVAYLPLQMTQSEASDLMFSSFLGDKERLAEIFGESLDPLLHLEAESEGFAYRLDLTAMNSEQTSTSFLRRGNLDKFVDQQFLDNTIKSFHDRITHSDCLFFDIDLFKKGVEINSVKQFARSAFEKADTIAEDCMRHLHSQPKKEQKQSHGRSHN